MSPTVGAPGPIGKDGEDDKYRHRLSSEAKSLLHGTNVGCHIKLPSRMIYLVVCTASQDLDPERRALLTSVIPELQEHCRLRSYRLTELDVGLPWKSLEHDAHCHKNACLQAVREANENCSLVALILMEDRVGELLLPEILDAGQYQLCKDAGIKMHDFYLQHDQDYLLKVKNEEAEGYRNAVDILQAKLPEGDRSVLLKSRFEELVFSIAELLDARLPKRCIWVKRKNLKKDENSIDPEDKRRVDKIESMLKARLEESSMVHFPVKLSPEGSASHSDYLEDLCARVTPILASLIDNIIRKEEDESLVHLRLNWKLSEELIQHYRTIHRWQERFHGREDALEKIKKTLEEDGREIPLIITGDKGCGKRTLASRVAQLLPAWFPGCIVIPRICGLTTRSSRAELIFTSLMLQGAYLCQEDPHPWTQLKNTRQNFEAMLRSLPSHQKVVFVLDGIHKVKDSPPGWDYLPVKLPSNVKLVLTLRSGLPTEDWLRERYPPHAFLQIPQFLPEQLWEITRKVFKESRIPLADRDKAKYLKIYEQESSPLTVQLMQYTVMEGDSGLPDAQNLEALFVSYIENLAKALGPQPVYHILSLLLAAKQGLSIDEILELIHTHSNRSDPGYAAHLWLRVTTALRPFLHTLIVGGVPLVSWSDHYTRQLLESKLHSLEGSAVQDNVFQRSCSALKDYFQSVESAKDNRDRKHAYDEIISLALRLDEDVKEKYIFDPGWLYRKVCESDVAEIISDIGLVLQAEPANPDVLLLRDFFRCAGFALDEDGRQFYAQFYVRLKEFLEKEKGGKYPAVERMWAKVREIPVTNLVPTLPCLLGPFQEPSLDSKHGGSSTIVPIPGNAGHMVTLVPSEKKLVVWDAHRAVPVRTLVGVPEPKMLKMVDAFRGVLLSGRELFVVDLNEGKIENKLKGMMNQKLPLYALQDSNHIVALARNRMYVNLIHLNTGDVVSTFKVGEDRFLNSLIVSDNGRLCVCGDETQKPFPLLVWDLEKRKLIFDLRIPHHEFLTHLTGITKEGHYVACACREVDGNDPVFIVVYDLQNGTPFKRMKPGQSFHSLAISSPSVAGGGAKGAVPSSPSRDQGNLVLCGLEDSRILVWDLITGNLKWTLRGHRAEVDVLCLDNEGEICLSYHSRGKDPTIRLWNLGTGNMMACFTPDGVISDCKISGDGRAVFATFQSSGAQLVTLWLHDDQGEGDGKVVIPPTPPLDYGDPAKAGAEIEITLPR